MNFRHAKTFLLGALVLSFLVSLFGGQISPYPLFVSYNIGISIIMAVSLNLINGYTGQFSLGHAGFMAVGAYTSAVITNQFGGLNVVLANGIFARRAARRRTRGGGRRPARRHSHAAVARRLSGHRHARLRRNHPRDFAEHERRRRRAGLERRAWLDQFVLDVRSRSGDGLCRRGARQFHLRPRLHRRPRRRNRRRGDGHQHDEIQSHRVRHRRIFCGHRGRALRALDAISHARRLRFHAIHHFCRHGHPRRHGQHRRRHSRRDFTDIAAGRIARARRRESPRLDWQHAHDHLFAAAHRADADAAAGLFSFKKSPAPK